MKKQFTHALLTRFNVGLYSDNPYGVANPDEWMRHRMELFRETVRSVRNQFVPPDGWFIQIDPKTPKEWIETIAKVSGATLIANRPSTLLTRPASKWLITTRLDNDDLILPHFIGSIQSEFRELEEVIDFDGSKLNPATGRTIEANRTSPSPFISLIEPWSLQTPPKTVLYQGGHARIGKKYPVRTIDRKGWIQVCHGKNVINSMD